MKTGHKLQGAGIDHEDVELLLKAVRLRFLSADREESDCAIITAIEGLKWLTGDPDSVVGREWLQQYVNSRK